MKRKFILFLLAFMLIGITACGTNKEQVNIEQEVTQTEEDINSVAVKAGLYDVDGVLLCTWEESGIDVVADDLHSPFETNEASAYYVLTNTYPTATTVVISEGVTSIGNGAFYYCEGLTSIIIPESVTSIGSNAFQICTSLTDITIPNNLSSIGSNVFYGCKNLTSITWKGTAYTEKAEFNKAVRDEELTTSLYVW